jgi:tol-pal system protein YbgF
MGVFLWGCATTQDVRILDGEIYKLQSQLYQIQKEKDAIKKELATLKTDLTAENQRVNSDLLLRLENLQSEVRILQTGIEEYKEFSKKPSKEIDRVKEDMQVRLRMLEERGKALEEKNKSQGEKIKELEDHLKGLEGKIAAPLKQTEVEKAAELKAISTGAGDLYKDAYETFQRGDLEAARRKFEGFLKQYPNTELSDNAQFWIGETYYLKKDFERAILEYEKAIAKYPEGDKIPAAMFKQALAFLELGDKTNGRNLLKRVIERYPHSDQAEMAKKKLEALK